MIQTADRLAEFAQRVADAPWVGLDTEADSLHAYPEKLCLLQISIPGADELVDPLVGLDLSALLEAFKKHTMIIHGADYDLRLLHRTFAFQPSSMFETVWAARLLGMEQFGLTSLVDQLLGVQLEKGSQKADWARRPLTPKMEEYARNDSKYLNPLAELLREKLIAAGRLDWHKECCARVITDSVRPQADDSDTAWRLTGSSKLSRRGMAILRELWLWREREAIACNKPPFFILRHETLVAMADLAGQGKPVENLFPRHFSTRRRGDIAVALEKALALRAEDWPQYLETRGRRMTWTEKDRLEAIKKIRDRVAAGLGIDPTLIASRAVLGALAMDWDKAAAELMRWQLALLLEAVPVGLRSS